MRLKPPIIWPQPSHIKFGSLLQKPEGRYTLNGSWWQQSHVREIAKVTGWQLSGDAESFRLTAKLDFCPFGC